MSRTRVFVSNVCALVDTMCCGRIFFRDFEKLTSNPGPYACHYHVDCIEFGTIWSKDTMKFAMSAWKIR